MPSGKVPARHDELLLRGVHLGADHALMPGVPGQGIEGVHVRRVPPRAHAQDGFQLAAVPGLGFLAAPPFEELPGCVLLFALGKNNVRRSRRGAHGMLDRAVGLPGAGHRGDAPPAVQLGGGGHELHIRGEVSDADGHGAGADAGEKVALCVDFIIGVHVRPGLERLIGFGGVQPAGFALAPVVIPAHLQKQHGEAPQRAGGVAGYGGVHRQGEAHVVFIQPGQHLLVQVAPGFGQLHAQLRQHVAPVDHAGKVHGLGQRVHPAVILEGHQAAGVKILCHVLKPGKLAQIAHGLAEGELVGQVVLHGQRHVRRGAAGDGEHDGVDRACGQLARGQHMQVDDDAGLGGEFLIGQLFQDFAPLRAAGDPHVQHGGFLVLCAAVVHDQTHAVVVLGKGCQEVFARHRHALEEIGGGDVHRHVGGGQHQVVHRHGAFFDGGNVGAQVALRVVQITEGFGNPVHILGEEVKLVDDLAEVVLHGGGFVGDGGQQIGAFLKPPGQVAQLSAQLRHGAVQIVFVVIVRFGAGDFHNFTLHPAQVGGVLFGTAHDFADGPQLHRGGQGVRALFQVEAIGGSVRVAEGVAIPMAVVGEGIQLHFLEGDLPVDHDLTIGGHTGVGGLQYFQVNGVQAAFRHVDVPAHRCVAQPPAVAAHDVQHPVRAGLGFGQGVGVGFAADDVFAAPGAVLGLQFDNGVGGHIFVSRRLPFRTLFRIGGIPHGGDEGDVSQHHGLIHVFQHDFMLARAEIELQGVHVNRLLIDRAHGLPHPLFDHVGPHFVVDGVDAHLAVRLHLFFKHPVEAQVVRFLIGRFTVDGEFALHFDFVAAQAQVGHLQLIQAGLLHGDFPRGAAFVIPGGQHKVRGFTLAGVQAGISLKSAFQHNIAGQSRVLGQQRDDGIPRRGLVYLGLLGPFRLQIAVLHGVLHRQGIQIRPTAFRECTARSGQAEHQQHDPGKTLHEKHPFLQCTLLLTDLLSSRISHLPNRPSGPGC